MGINYRVVDSVRRTCLNSLADGLLFAYFFFLRGFTMLMLMLDSGFGLGFNVNSLLERNE
jgi:hypothetical protein